jgi:hypothetical protein
MQLWRKATSAVWASNISWAQKLYLNWCGLRCTSHIAHAAAARLAAAKAVAAGAPRCRFTRVNRRPARHC